LPDPQNLLKFDYLSMLLPVFQDLIKPQWRAVLEELKLSGGLPVSELARRVDASYMAVKQHCEELKKLGYLDRSRVPRTVVGRPEIFYSLSAKADGLFPQAGGGFTLDLLQETKALFGENTPDKLLFQHFQKQQEKWLPLVSKEPSLGEKVAKLVSLRNKEGCFGRCVGGPGLPLSIEEFHNPLQRMFECYPRAAAAELRMIEQLLGARVSRRELPGGRTGQPRVIFEVSAA
jgi:predicted ArsR family transcriptional regulator